MDKKSLLKSYLKSHVDFEGLHNDWLNSWLVCKPKSWLYCNGIVSEYFTYTLINDAIEYAGYKYPKSDKTWLTVDSVKRDLINEYVFN